MRTVTGVFTLAGMLVWFVLLHLVLVQIQASETMFLLYWVYVTVTVSARTMARLVESR